MEAAIQTLVKVFLKSTKGKECLGKREFQSLVKSQLSNILSVRKSLLNISELLLALCNHLTKSMQQSDISIGQPSSVQIYTWAS